LVATIWKKNLSDCWLSIFNKNGEKKYFRFQKDWFLSIINKKKYFFSTVRHSFQAKNTSIIFQKWIKKISIDPKLIISIYWKMFFSHIFAHLQGLPNFASLFPIWMQNQTTYQVLSWIFALTCLNKY